MSYCRFYSIVHTIMVNIQTFIHRERKKQRGQSDCMKCALSGFMAVTVYTQMENNSSNWYQLQFYKGHFNQIARLSNNKPSKYTVDKQRNNIFRTQKMDSYTVSPTANLNTDS